MLMIEAKFSMRACANFACKQSECFIDALNGGKNKTAGWNYAVLQSGVE